MQIPYNNLAKGLWRISNGKFSASLEINEKSLVSLADPIVKYMRNWNYDKVKRHCQYKNWKLEKLAN